jgi:RNA polymerase sigma-70 factor
VPAAGSDDDGLQDRLVAARQAWPLLRSPVEGFAAHVAERWPTGPAASCALGDLYLAYAAMSGEAAAVEAVGKMAREAAVNRGRALGLTDAQQRTLADDALHKVLVPGVDDRVSLGAYRGQGPLGGYLATVVVHLATDEQRGPARARPSMLEGKLIAGGDGPELVLARRQIQLGVKAAFQSALGDLDHRDRVVLKLAYVQGLTGEQVGRIYGVDRATGARWITAARQRLWEHAKAHLAAAHPDVAQRELEDAVNELAASIDLSLSRILSV